ncbi:MAG TPA: glucose-6-phosphate dehydrogenase [Thermomicrobiales bacterium]|nr:glucose-6-phosphate dehydrogenase [Thermomicrobiales bacterium]
MSDSRVITASGGTLTAERARHEPASKTYNPLRLGLQSERNPQACAMVIFGVSGDLTSRKLMPALYDLYVSVPLPPGFSIVGISRRDWSDDAFRAEMRDAVKEHATRPFTDEAWDSFARGLFYVQGDFDDSGLYDQLRDRLETVDTERGTNGNHLYYLATPPSFYAEIAAGLGNAGLAKRQEIYSNPRAQGWNRIVIEKPFGHDLKSAQHLNAAINAVFAEPQIYRIDHYLGKETVQNVLAFRFANILFEPVWNRHYVDQIQITVAESLGIENRAAYYEEAGALRDMVQSHMLQLLSVVAMEPPAFFNGDALRDEKVKVLRSVVPPDGDRVAMDVVRGQYTDGYVAGTEVVGYRDEEKVNPDSRTETFVALKLEIDNWRWNGVPFYLRTGKRMPRRVTEIAIQFKSVPHLMFKLTEGQTLPPNVLTMRIQPDEGISLRVAAKVPGAGTKLQPVQMDFDYGASFGQAGPDAYVRLLLDAMLGDPTLFARDDEIDTAWSLMQPILDVWADQPVTMQIPSYEAGTWGPVEAELLLANDRRTWRRP